MNTVGPGIPVRTAAGGHVIPGEASSQTIVRELREELGLDLDHPFLKIITWAAPTDPERPGSFTYVFDLGQIKMDFQIVPKEDEIGAWQWVERALIREMVNPVEGERIRERLSAWHADGPLYMEQWPGGKPR
jgi:8-oxo-dGTP pyrophosphatase MutT (NUDIX family)